MIPFLYLAVLNSCLSIATVIGPGLAIYSVWQHHRGKVRNDAASLILIAAAIGVYLNSALFLVGQRFSLNFTSVAAVLIFAAVHSAIILAVYQNRRYRAVLLEYLKILRHQRLLILLLPATFIGAWAFAQFPHTFDSGQLAWTQRVIHGTSPALPIESMLGFSALTALYAGLTPTLPLATSASGFKPFLFFLALLISIQAACVLKLSPRWLAAVAYLAIMLATPFGTYGLIETGKDSIYGIIFMMAMLITMMRDDARDCGFEIGILFAAAALTGIIAVPYAAVAYALWLLFSPAQAGRTLAAVYFVNLPFLPLIVGAFTLKAIPLMFGVYTLTGAIGASGWYFGRGVRLPQLPPLVLVAATALAAAATALLLPIKATILVAQFLDGTVDVRSYPPTDGKTNLLQLFMGHPYQSVTIAIGCASIFFVPLLSRWKNNIGLIAAGAMPFFVLFIVVAHSRLGLNVLSPFNTWDLSKDIPMWLGGTLIALFAVLGCFSLGERINRIVGPSALISALAVSALAYAYPRFDLRHFRAPVYYDHISGSDNPDMVTAARLSWERLNGRMMYVHRSTSLAHDNYFHSLPRFGVAVSWANDDLKGVIIGEESGFAVPLSSIPSLMKIASSASASITYIAPLNNDAALLVIKNDKNNDVSVPKTVLDRMRTGSATVIDGGYGRENYEGLYDFSWMMSAANIQVTTPLELGACVKLQLFASNEKSGDVQIRVPNGAEITSDIRGFNIRKQKQVDLPVPAGSASSTISLRTLFPATTAPDDTRPMGFGIRLPIRIGPLRDCVP